MQKHPAPVQSARTFFPPLPEGEPLLALNEFELAARWRLTLPLFRVALNPRFTRPFYAVPRTSAARTASG